MCGIAGIWNRDRKPVERMRLASLTDCMKHRGPDASGLFVDGDCGLGHRRLSIIDLEGSHQPMSAAGKPLHIVYNGEIYNYRELRDELLRLGYRFETSGDTEVILVAYQAWGVECLQRFRGMFAFSIWDEEKRELFLARDRFGIKPLCMYRDEWGFAFSSEIQAFKAMGKGFDKSLSLEALDLYLYYGYIPAPQSIFKNVYKLPPAHYCLLRSPDDELTFTCYWDFRFQADRTLDEDQWQEGLEEKLRDAVKVHLVADVPVGAFLSGGIDSSVVVAMMTQLSKDPVLTYTIGFNYDDFDERPITRKSSRVLSIKYHEELLELEILNTLDVLVGHFGEPFADSSAVCTYQVTGVAARDVKVMLSGDGGDEIFTGYSHYGWILREYLPNFTPEMRARLLITDLLRRVGLRKPRITPYDGWVGRNGYFTKSDREALWLDEYSSLPAQTDAFLARRFASLRHVCADNLIDTVQCLDITDYLPFNNLNKVDIASMCHGLEVRVPLLDHELAEFAAKIPWKQRIRELMPGRKAESAMHGYVNKYPLRRIAEKTFGHGFFDRRKMGFAMPIDSFLASESFFPELSNNLISPSSPLLKYFEKQALIGLLEKHKQSQSSGLKLWSLLFLNRWLQRLDA